MFYKPEFRKSLRERRRHLDPASMQQAAKQVAAQLVVLPKFIESETIAFYIAQENELDPSVTIQAAQQFNKKFFLPVVPTDNEKNLSFYAYHSEEDLIKNRFDILEPKTSAASAVNIASLDIILVPLVGFDKECNRLGRGAGYYDHTLAFAKDKSAAERPLLIGLGYEFQKLPEIVPSKWDVPLDLVVTEDTIYRRW